MALVYNTNLTPATYGECMHNFKTFMKLRGWTVPKSGDGLSLYGSSSDVITTSATGAAGYNTSTWFILSKPSGGKHFMFQQSYSGSTWTIKLSFLGFSGGSPSSTTAPTATDEATLVNASSIFSGSEGTQKQQILADGASPYGFIAVTYPNGGGDPTSVMMMDPLVAGTYPSEDIDPYVYYFSTSSPFDASNGIVSESSGPVGYLSATLTSGNLKNTPGHYPTSSGGSIVNNLSVNPFNGKDEGLNILYARRAGATSPTGRKGQSSLVKFLGASRSTGDTLGTKTRLILKHCSVPWDGSTTPSV